LAQPIGDAQERTHRFRLDPHFDGARLALQNESVCVALAGSDQAQELDDVDVRRRQGVVIDLHEEVSVLHPRDFSGRLSEHIRHKPAVARLAVKDDPKPSSGRVLVGVPPVADGLFCGFICHWRSFPLRGRDNNGDGLRPAFIDGGSLVALNNRPTWHARTRGRRVSLIVPPDGQCSDLVERDMGDPDLRAVNVRVPCPMGCQLPRSLNFAQLRGSQQRLACTSVEAPKH
jgi:hypothetical protein